MDTVLLAWNPARFPWGNLQDELSEIRRKGQVTDRWSVGNRTTLKPGSRFFLIRLGVEPRGLVGSGWTTSAPFDGPHWDFEKAANGDTTKYADLYFDALAEDPIIPMDDLRHPPFSNVHWSTQISGIQIPAPVAEELETIWAQRTATIVPGGREEFSKLPNRVTNHSARVYVNRYERSPQARALCLSHYGSRCCCCDVLLEEIYGAAARDVIHVHHLTALSAIPEGAEIDPITDLRPVCPNCHCVIHTTEPPHTIEEVRTMLGKSGRSTKKARR
jgi:5-methylcytosine-specific restriction protein A